MQDKKQMAPALFDKIGRQDMKAVGSIIFQDIKLDCVLLLVAAQHFSSGPKLDIYRQ